MNVRRLIVLSVAVALCAQGCASSSGESVAASQSAALNQTQPGRSQESKHDPREDLQEEDNQRTAASPTLTLGQESKEKPENAPAAVPGEVTRALFGVRLGESITALQSRTHLTQSTYRYTDPDHPGVIFDVPPGDAQVKALRVSAFEACIYAVSIDLRDTSRTNYQVISAELLRKYGGDKPGLTDCLFDEVTLHTMIDGVPVRIHLNRDMGIGEPDTLCLMYTHQALQVQVNQEIERRKAARISDKL